MPSDASDAAPDRIDSALPSVTARVFAFAAILVAGGAGALIGSSYAVISCDGPCPTRQGLFLWLGSVITACGVAVIAVLTLRALAEWSSRDPGR